MNKYIVVNFSGGKDSTAMLLGMIERGEHIDEVICCDTYKEFPAMYRHIDRVRQFVESHGIKFTIIRHSKTFDYFMFEHRPKYRINKDPNLPDRIGRGWPTSRNRWCTRELKTDLMENYLRELRKKYDVKQCIGLALDEGDRLDRKNNKNRAHNYPLIRWGMTEQDALEYCYSKGYDWEGLYKTFKRVSCWCCPLQSLEELRKLRKYFPDLWRELGEMDQRTWIKFRPDYSVQQLDARFELEEERIAAGLPTGRKKEFREALKKRFEERGLL